ncbi:MAG: hypothetical protein JSR96_13085 [Proteobacteria bacterium]|nr:hypothetical protein [Pseudomonadota bacterium]
MEYAMVDATIVKRQGSPTWPGRKRGTQSQAIGRSKGGMTTKILALTDDLSVWSSRAGDRRDDQAFRRVQAGG